MFAIVFPSLSSTVDVSKSADTYSDLHTFITVDFLNGLTAVNQIQQSI